MDYDLKQFFAMFFEESQEGLEQMEEQLINIDIDDFNLESIDTIFRAAHSIKGGAATFGFRNIAEFTHVIETLLDEIRSEKQQLTTDMVDVLLSSVDHLGSMFEFEKERTSKGLEPSGEESNIKNNSVAYDIHNKLQSMLKDNTNILTSETNPICKTEERPSSAEQDNSASSSGDDAYAWKVKFIPDTDILKTGNDPIKIFKELASYTDIKVNTIVDKMPSFDNLDPCCCCLYWEVLLGHEISKDQIMSAFEWVVDECQLDIEPFNVKHNSENITVLDEQDQSSEMDKQDDKTEKKEEEKEEETVNIESIDKEHNQNVSKHDDSHKVTTKKRGNSSNSDSGSIRVGIDKIDHLVNLAGELVITQSMLSSVGDEFSEHKFKQLKQGLVQLQLNTRELQESVIRIRMLPISQTFTRFKRMVRDITKELGKNVELEIIGENTELDKTVLERISDPLIHLVRNSLDHGIETPEQRAELGKPRTGVLRLQAFHQSGNIIIEISDDGKGLPIDIIRKKAIAIGLINQSDNLSKEEIQDLIFNPGFSTAEKVTDLSGRGVGMDVVRRNIQDLNGHIEVKSEEGVGTKFTIRLPLTLAILDGQLVRLGTETYIIPLVNIIESIPIKNAPINKVIGGHDVVNLRDEYIPLIRMHHLFNVPESKSLWRDGLMVIVEVDNRIVGLVVDELLSQQQVVIKSMETNYHKVDGIAGATILGDGRVSLILEVGDVVKMACLQNDHETITNNISDIGDAAA